MRKRSLYAGLNENEWTVRIECFSGKFRDVDNHAGVRQTACDQYDILDMMDPPPINSRFVNVFFDDKNWRECPGLYSGSFKTVTTDGQYFDFSVHAENTDESLDLQFATENTLPSDFTLSLIDLDERTSRQIALNQEILISPARGKTTKNYRLIVGNQKFYDENNLGVGVTPNVFHLA